MTTRLMRSGRFAYAMGYKSADDAYEAMCNMVNDCELSPGEGKIEPYNSSGTPRHARTRYAITVE